MQRKKQSTADAVEARLRTFDAAASEKLGAARLRASHQWKYLSALLWGFVPIETRGIGTIGCDKYLRLYYDPSAVHRWTVEELSVVLYHECGHIFRSHSARGENIPDATPLALNIAGDLEINDDLENEGLKLPDDPATPKRFGLKEGLFMEEYLELMREQAGQQGGGSGSGQPDPNGDPQQGQGGSGQGDGDDQSDGDGGGQGDGDGDSDGDGDGPGEWQPGSSPCGSCATGKPEDYELPPPAGDGEVPGLTKGQTDLVKRKVAEDIKDAAKQRGTVPGGWVRWADELLDPVVPWHKILRGTVRRAVADIAGMVDYTMRKPSRRQGAAGDVILQALRAPKIEVCVVEDTSGSMSTHMMKQGLTEAWSVMRSCGLTDIWALACDADVQKAQRIRTKKQLLKLAEGGGGTDMRIGIRAALKTKPKPQVIIVFTDGYTPWPEHPIPGVTLIACIVEDERGNPGDTSSVPKWARCVDISEINKRGRGAA